MLCGVMESGSPSVVGDEGVGAELEEGHDGVAVPVDGGEDQGCVAIMVLDVGVETVANNEIADGGPIAFFGGVVEDILALAIGRIGVGADFDELIGGMQVVLEKCKKNRRIA